MMGTNLFLRHFLCPRDKTLISAQDENKGKKRFETEEVPQKSVPWAWGQVARIFDSTFRMGDERLYHCYDVLILQTRQKR